MWWIIYILMGMQCDAQCTFSWNRVKRLIGHTKFSTSSDVYGNKEIRGTEDERRAIAAAKANANNSNIFSKIVKNN